MTYKLSEINEQTTSTTEEMENHPKDLREIKFFARIKFIISFCHANSEQRM